MVKIQSAELLLYLIVKDERFSLQIVALYQKNSKGSDQDCLAYQFIT